MVLLVIVAVVFSFKFEVVRMQTKITQTFLCVNKNEQ